MQGALSFWLSLILYGFAIIAISAIHFLAPMESELFDTVDVYYFFID
jgi:hypothetical protein